MCSWDGNGTALLELTSLVTIDLNGNDIGLLPLGFVQLPKLVRQSTLS